jgi:hypothetical protein
MLRRRGGRRPGFDPGAFLAALLIAQAKAFCIGLGFSEATLVDRVRHHGGGAGAAGPGACLGRMPAREERRLDRNAALNFQAENSLGGAALLASRAASLRLRGLCPVCSPTC